MPGSLPIEVDVRLGMSDLFPAFFMMFFRRVGWIFAVVMFFVSLNLIFRLLGYGRQTDDPSYTFTTLVVPFSLFFIILVALPYSSARSTLRSSKMIQGTMRYVFLENGMDSSAVGASGHIDWSSVHKVVETRGTLLIYPSKQIMYVVPKRCFANAESVESVRQLIRERVTGKLKLRSGTVGRA